MTTFRQEAVGCAYSSLPTMHSIAARPVGRLLATAAATQALALHACTLVRCVS